ncbi:MAG TPA: hypothetical protein DD381_04700 [Lentisphaeria bacterium]|nr:MAG: hypothetical protein A2X47_01610 [Lentisphaerae bacterium GWF2_38_69]HBM15630.1 hypothetical protein [Lentisphaeria bacterium]
MPWEVVKREDNFEGSNQAFISISADHIALNSLFTRLADIDTRYRVTFFVDSENLRLGLEFHQDERKDSFALSPQSSANKGEKRQSLQCSSAQTTNRYPWIKAITKFPAKDRRFFNPKKEGKIWAFQLCPSFDEKKARESSNIPSEIKGIYRYLRENGEIVYIGRGAIAARLRCPERSTWDFDTVEYSIIKDDDQQVKWEAYWIEKFKENNKGQLPFYNKVSGCITES